MASTTTTSRGDEIVGALLTQPYPYDPYPLYAELRELAPVYPSQAGMHVLTTYEGVSTVFRSPQFGQGEAVNLVKQDPRYEWSTVLQSLGSMMVFMDPPDHTRLRRIVARVFSPRMIEDLRPYVQQVIDDLIAEFAGDREADLVTQFGDLIPVTVICELLGVPHSDHEQCRAWSEEIALAIEPVVPDEYLRRADAATEAYNDYFNALVDEKRRDPKDDLLTLLSRAEDDGDTLNNAELVAMATLLIGAGFETTRNGIAGGIQSLLAFPDQLRKVRDDPSRDKAMTDEVLRYVSPNQTAIARFALEDVELEGTRIPEGAVIAPVIAAANRDPQRFPNPEVLDVDRSDNLPLTFAPGPHLCLGAPVARLEVELAITSLIRRFPQLEPQTDTPPMRPTCALGPGPRGPAHLPVTLSSPASR